MTRLWPCLALLLAGEADRPEGLYPDRDAVPGRDAVALTQDAGAETGARLGPAEGVWMLHLTHRTCLEALGQRIEQVVTTTYRVTLTEEIEGPGPDERYGRQTLRMCQQLVSPAVGGLQTFIPQTVPESLPDRLLEAVLTELGEEGPTRYVTPEHVDRWGTTDFPVEDPMPTEPDDPRVIDQDEDGQPGVSIVVGNNLCQIFLAQRTRQRLSGLSVGADRVEGTFSSIIEQSVLGATAALCTAMNAQLQAPRPNPFVLMRIDGELGSLSLDLDADGEITCGEILSAEPALIEAGEIAIQAPEDGVCDL